jgi:hypothetical protein
MEQKQKKKHPSLLIDFSNQVPPSSLQVRVQTLVQELARP